MSFYPVYSRSEITIQASPEVIWNILIQAQNWAQWNPLADRVEGTAPLELGRPLRWRSKGLWIKSTPEEIQPAQRLVWRGATFGTQAWHSWELSHAAEGMKVFTEERFEGWLVRLFPRKFQGELDKALRVWLESLKAEAESLSTSSMN